MLGTSRPTPGQSPFQTRKQEGSVRDFQHVPLQGPQTCSGFGSRRKEKPTASFSGTYRFQALAPTFPFPTAGVCSKDRRGPCTIILRTKISQNPGMLWELLQKAIFVLWRFGQYLTFSLSHPISCLWKYFPGSESCIPDANVFSLPGHGLTLPGYVGPRDCQGSHASAEALKGCRCRVISPLAGLLSPLLDSLRKSTIGVEMVSS